MNMTVTATELKANCLDILDRLASHDLEKVFVTKRGKIVGMLSPRLQLAIVTRDEKILAYAQTGHVQAIAC